MRDSFMQEHGTNRPSDLIIFGGTGDLAMRMLFPSLYFLDSDGHLADDVRIIGAARSDLDRDGFLKTVHERLKSHIAADYYDEAQWQRFAKRIDYCPVDAVEGTGFDALAKAVRLDEGGELVCYFSTAPRFYGDICTHLEANGLAGKNTRVVLEKPIGHDLESCRAVNDAVGAVFTEDRIYRIDHYLGKETVQNLLALRFANSLFEPLWNANGIEQVQITISETVGVEGRWSYYNDSGALRDMLQNHMLQLLCLVAMEPPSTLDADAVRDEKLKVLRSLRPITKQENTLKSVAGQYTEGAVGGTAVPGYLDEAQQESRTETFVALRADIDNWRWRGVPFYLRTGKRLPYRYSEIFIQFKGVPHSIFPEESNLTLDSNKLVIRLQPEENIKLCVMNKVPGLGRDGMKLQEVSLDLSMTKEARTRRRRIAYERLLLDVLNANSTLFVRRDETEAAWAWVDGISKGWRDLDLKPKPYSAGTWGPAASVALTERYGHSWHD
ncbi:glucose-6-phosphate 1-dehydrogenase [Iodidimonas gelatinilytica]|uniref:Glucose-6-phosphate 1-dehydrogenase n=2 Tax=Iodidimonas gelatinilytica TaxID=1236966 RepID=A0A5A7MZG7_9PROT|nr:glucose-6-phosphate dehydrogenase [Iodidimonas gelatinilytica]GER00794.1 glucose-6-phosphate 1-dehydrogenase [Iodidimonas gelatinilytica]